MGLGSLVWLAGDSPSFGTEMVKQIKEQVEILCHHVGQGEIDLEFIALHALHLSQLATFLRSKQVPEISKRQEEFLYLISL
jgi:hypothetical protein